MPDNFFFLDERRECEYRQKLLGLFGSSLIGYWPMNEASGTVAADYAPAVNLMTNGGFETAGAGGADIWGTWSETAGNGALADEAVLVHGGSHAAKLTAGAAANTEVTNTIAVVPGKDYSLNFWTEGDGTNGGRYAVYDVTNAAYIVAVTATGITGAAYAQINRGFTTPASCVSIRIELWCPTANGGIAYFDDVQLIGQKHGTYVGVTLGQLGIGDGLTCPLFDGVNDYMQPPAGFRAAFNPQEGTLCLWLKNNIAWADATIRGLFRISIDGNNLVQIDKGGSNIIDFYYIAGGVTNLVQRATTETAWSHVSLTWSTSALPTGEMKAYFGGLQVGATQTGLGVWAGVPIAFYTNIGTITDTPNFVWDGWIAHACALNRAATPGEVVAAAII